jgi:ATP-dependent protease Clp ATPase subunit
VEDPAAELKKILADPKLEERAVAAELVEEFARRFQENHGIRIRFTPAATQAIVEEALQRSQSVRELCASHFKDFHFGLRLIEKNIGPREFVIDRDAVEAPDKVLSEWVIASYRPKDSADAVQ